MHTYTTESNLTERCGRVVSSAALYKMGLMFEFWPWTGYNDCNYSSSKLESQAKTAFFHIFLNLFFTYIVPLGTYNLCS
jgi:hypothetical protein